MRENCSQAMVRRLSKGAWFFAGYWCLFLLFRSFANAAELPLVRIAHGISNCAGEGAPHMAEELAF